MRIANYSLDRADLNGRLLSRLVAAVLVLLLSACVGGGDLRAAPEPALASNFADPFVLPAPAGFIAFATNSGGVNVQVARSADLNHWRLEAIGAGVGGGGSQLDALPVLPSWIGRSRAGREDVWAPEVVSTGGRWVMFFSARSATEKRPDGDARECIGTATSRRPDRDYQAQRQPLICDAFLEGVIDPSPFRDADGRLYLYFKSDGNCCGRPTGLYVQSLAPDGLTTTSPAKPLEVSNDRPWEGDVVEAPTMVSHNGRYVLFFSGGDYGSGGYAVGYAACATALGPCRQAAENPILKTSAEGLIGPGHQSVFTVGGRSFIAYHAWSAGPGEGRGAFRQLYVSNLAWVDERPVVEPGNAAAPVVVH